MGFFSKLFGGEKESTPEMLDTAESAAHDAVDSTADATATAYEAAADTAADIKDTTVGTVGDAAENVAQAADEMQTEDSDTR